MSVQASKVYRFATAEQWNTCLFSKVDRSLPALAATVQPTAPYADRPARFPSAGAFAPAVSPACELLWRTADGMLARALSGDPVAESNVAPLAIARSSRLIATARGLWTIGPDSSTLQCFELDSLSRSLVADFAPSRLVDFARDAGDALLVLVQRGSEFHCLRVDCGGRVSEGQALHGVPPLVALASLPHAAQLMVLAADGSTAYGFARGESTANFVASLGTLHACFKASTLASDGRLRFFVGGKDDSHFGGTPRVLVLDSDGLKVDEVTLDAEPTGLAGNASSLLVALDSGLDVYPTTQIAANSAAAVCTLITPALFAPTGVGTSRWLRAEMWASLPLGTTLEFSYVASDDDALHDQALQIAADTSIPASLRMLHLQSLLGEWSRVISFNGSDASAALTDTSPPIAAPLFDATLGHLWISVTLSAAPGAPLPMLARLDVRYCGRSLLDNLPLIYRRDALGPGNFMRALIGILEATTQETDRRIGSMASAIHPDTAPVEWLDYVARWLGLPWDDGLNEAQKRAIASQAAPLAAARGTRRGLTTLLDCLLPGQPRRYSVTDINVEYGLATAGGRGCEGSRLPAVLAGLPNCAAILTTRTILGQARLPCPQQSLDITSRFLGQLQVEIVATAQERSVWSPWIRGLIASMIPAFLQLKLSWRSPAIRGNELTADGLQLLADPVPHLGTDAITGYSRLPPNQRLM